jgi:hypothetical protein
LTRWVVAVPLAWAASLAIVVVMQGYAGVASEARGPAHFHAHEGDHGHLAHHHHGPEADVVLVSEPPLFVEGKRFDTVTIARISRAGSPGAARLTESPSIRASFSPPPQDRPPQRPVPAAST